MSHAPTRLLIVGNGMAAARLAELLTTPAAAARFELVIFGDEPGGCYNRILLSGVLSGSYAGPDIVTHPREWYSEQGIELRSGSRIERIDPNERVVFDGHGRRESFDVLVLATGSRPALPPIAGLTADQWMAGTFVFRTVEDCARIAAAASTARCAVVIGGGLLGIEAARGLLEHGLDVTVVHRAGHVMESQLDLAAGRLLQRELERMGIAVLADRSAQRILGDDRVTGLQFDDGSHIDCDVLVVATGVIPNTQLAREAGLEVERGIVVGDDLACPGTADIYAIGDCAQHRGRTYGLVAPAWEQAEVLASRLLDRESTRTYAGSRLTTKLKVAGIDVAVMGQRDEEPGDDVITYVERARGVYNRVIVRDDRVVGAIVIGAPAVVPSLVQRFLDVSPVPMQRSELLFPPAFDVAPRSMEEMPDTARICDCNAVVKSQIVDAVLDGARSLRAVCERTRAGTGCGSCKPELQRIVDFVCASIESPTGATREASEGVRGTSASA